jgi:hypothetical protein|tara:strand:+ start:254 stop:409 length:156 start_codon:yes stop_codon:yes gene_type:complete
MYPHLQQHHGLLEVVVELVPLVEMLVHALVTPPSHQVMVVMVMMLHQIYLG